jgi:hypothetical protein
MAEMEIILFLALSHQLAVVVVRVIKMLQAELHLLAVLVVGERHKMVLLEQALLVKVLLVALVMVALQTTPVVVAVVLAL